MATPLTADQVLTACRAVGLSPREVPRWRDRGMWRIPEKGWTPKWITIHHTAGNLGSRTPEQYIADIINGDKAVPDKANAVIDPDGVLWLNAAGRANHHLLYSELGKQSCERDAMPLDRQASMQGSLQNGNEYSYGVECIAAGVPNDKQRATAVGWAAAIAKAHGWSGRETVGHGELAADRSNAIGPAGDPGWDMAAFRRDVMAAVKGGTTAPATPSPATGGSTMPKSPNDGGWLLQAGTKDNDQVGASLPILYRYKFDLNQPAIPGRSLDPSDIANLADFQRVAGLVAGQGLDWPTMQALQYYDRISLHWANANPGGLKLDIGATQWALARLGLMGDWDWWGGVGTFGPRTTEAVNRFYDREKAILGKGDGKWGPMGFGLLASRTGVFTCTTPYATPQPQSLPSTAGRVASPVPGVGIGTFYGKRKAGLWRAKGYHTGDDYPGAEGASAVAVRSGTVTVRDDGALGCIAILSADNGRHYWYCHLQRGSRVTGRVSAGQVIGRVGHTGSGALGPHLHFEDNGSRTQWGTDRKPTW